VVSGQMNCSQHFPLVKQMIRKSETRRFTGIKLISDH